MSECILCGAPPPLTEEHIWPDWYSRMRKHLEFRFDGTIAGRPHITRRVQKFDLAPGVLCVPCNTVWGSKLEVAAGDILKPMLDGHTQALDGPSLKTLAIWATLKFMVSEYLSSTRAHFYTEAERHWLREKNRPPLGTTIWIGHYVGDFKKTGRFEDDRSLLSVARLTENPEKPIEGWSAALTIGQVVLQLFAINHYEELSGIPNLKVAQSRPDWELAMPKVWPVPERPYNWPPQKALSDVGFETLMHRWDQIDAP